MPINQALLGEFDHEMANTRKTLERVPDNKWDWAPHPKSMKLGALAKHLAEMPGWTVNALTTDSIDIAPDGKPMQTPPAKNRQEALALFDKNVAAARKALAAANDDAQWMKPWALLMTGKTIFSMPKVAVVRSFVLNHEIHHRAQLGVYLRLNDIPVPAIYGPSADENTF
ncbi:MAG TPA: DinB family protein [Terriglobales bacterium]|jgi:uncharacterized damage-inducible protein DinB|nr:DinB family protein [Terriglobales bacterium]